jgi:hypothetical protein
MINGEETNSDNSSIWFPIAQIQILDLLNAVSTEQYPNYYWNWFFRQGRVIFKNVIL